MCVLSCKPRAIRSRPSKTGPGLALPFPPCVCHARPSLLSGCSFCMKARAGDGVPCGSFFSRSKTPLGAIMPGAVLALVSITQATKHPRAPVTVRGEMRRLGLSKPIEHDGLLWKLGGVVAPSPGKLLQKHSGTTARGACPVALHSRRIFTRAFGEVFYPRVR